MNYTDTHAHLERLEEAHTQLEALFDAGFGKILDIGTVCDDLAGRIAEFGRYPEVRFAAGIWPYPQAVSDRERMAAVLEAQIEAAPPGFVVAVGECGLDHHQEQPDKAGERELFEAHIALAARFDLPLVVHSRDAPTETLAVLRDHPGIRGIIHCYSYGVEEARVFLELGYHISFAGNLTYKKSDSLRETLRFIPDDRLLLETDSPFLAPQSHRGQPCRPGFIAETYALAAELRGMDRETLKELIAANADALLFA
ncbi:MAG: TatD family hydrolase [Spirochaetaceae bacterium]|jgi:TatD DNase family protein|nr:TatD family hydrolase [Spirochaetaceae bacterium]